MATIEKTSRKRRKRARKPAKPAEPIVTIGERIKLARQSAGLAQVPLAEKCGLSQAHICGLERGTKQPSVDTLIKIAAALGVTVGQLIGESAGS